jgi:hypothetical protein
MLINKGSLDDIRCSLKLCESAITINQLNNEIEAEMKWKCRTSVINLLNAAIKRKMKTDQGLPQFGYLLTKR